MARPEYMLFDNTTTAIIYGYQQNAIQRMLDFDYACGRKTPSVAAIVNTERSGLHKVFFGKKEILVPMYRTLAEAASSHPSADVMVNFASFRSSYPTTKEALGIGTIRTVAVIAEGIPERRAKELAEIAKQNGKWVIGPATVGGLMAGAFKIGNTGGTIDNILASKLHRPGSVGFVSKSGGMSNEMNNIISRSSDGVYESIAIGGDAFPGSTLIEHLFRYEANPDIKMMVCLGEVGGTEEYKIVEAMKSGKLTKPLVIWVTGTCAKMFSSGVQFGHAGAKADGAEETADAKNKALAEAGAYVPHSFDDFGDKIREVYEGLTAKGKIIEKTEAPLPQVPEDFAAALKAGKIRKSANIISTISDDSGEELLYAGYPISHVIEKGFSLGDVVGLLWFKRKLPEYASRFIEMVLKITADHGPCVSGAHNTIIGARAGKDLMSSVAMGILTIGPRFGGAIDDAARYFSDAHDRGLTPKQFMDEMKAKGINIPGIGHRVKSVQNPDMRVTLLKKYAKENFPATPILDYALEVEKLTTSKKNNLILNVDGCIGILFMDLMRTSEDFTAEEVKNVLDLGYLNGLFVLGRSIGMIGHYLDQKRLEQPLYRHPYDDVAYMLPEPNLE
ncbi:MAG: ATP citrate synthase [Thermoplasmata archaeon HGW-Thermoplasmata-1]|nr:MAG: ATP citrate synthase [Thermoplasmata archaeon HGW-Thermoplasmata-1]